jgi:hypothetical protein
MPHETSFTVKTAHDFFVQIVLPQYQDFVENNSSARHALLSIITPYHMGEWRYEEKFRSGKRWRPAARNAGVLEDFQVAEMITNGTKHMEPKSVTTRTQGGFSSAFSSAFARCLMIRKQNGNEISADDLLERLINFWKNQKALGEF